MANLASEEIFLRFHHFLISAPSFNFQMGVSLRLILFGLYCLESGAGPEVALKDYPWVSIRTNSMLLNYYRILLSVLK
jgi:hypothetical protein